jgi:hypothetical protein
MDKIEKLTPEQEQQLHEWRKRWFAIGSCCAPADRVRAEAAITTMYTEIGEKPPKFVWVQSPATGVLAICAINKLGEAKVEHDLGDSLWTSLRDSLGDSLRDSLWTSLGGSLRDSLRDSLWTSLRDSLRDSLWTGLGGSLWTSLRDSLRDSLGDSLGDLIWCKTWWGQQEAYWIAYYAFCRDVIGVRYDDKRLRQLDLWSGIAQSCGWWWPYRNVCVVSERPEVVRWEADRNPPRLHSEGGPALRYRDGWEVYSWHGLRVPKRIIDEPETITVAEIHAEQNQEQRRAMIERIGWMRYCEKAGAREVHRDDFGALLEMDGLGDGDTLARFVRVRDPSTGREYVLRVPPTVKTVREAVAWTFDVPEEQYAPTQET